MSQSDARKAIAILERIAEERSRRKSVSPPLRRQTIVRQGGDPTRVTGGGRATLSRVEFNFGIFPGLHLAKSDDAARAQGTIVRVSGPIVGKASYSYDEIEVSSVYNGSFGFVSFANGEASAGSESDDI